TLDQANRRADRNRTPWVVLGIVLLVLVLSCVLAGPLIVGLLSAWESARRNMCTDHMKDIGLALQSYHELHGSFPPGWEVPEADPSAPAWGWQARALTSLSGNVSG